MDKQQIFKLLNVALVMTSIMLICEIIFAIPAINNFFSNLILNANGVIVYLIIWLIMFLQVTVLNIPAYVVLSASLSVGLNILSIEYIVITVSAYMLGCILAYWLGRKFGVKALKWCAGSEEDYNKWSTIINTKGKWFYFLTILLPMFPDDLLCIVAGSTKFNFGQYVVFNLIGRTIGLVTMCVVLKFIGMSSSSFPFMVLIWALAVVTEIILILIVKRKMKNEIQNDN